MIRPSQLRSREFLRSVKPESVDQYLLSKQWTYCYVETNLEEPLRWWYFHVSWPLLNSNLRFSDGYMTAYNIPQEAISAAAQKGMPNPNYLVSLCSNKFSDYDRHISWLLEDLEMHEDRWCGQILDEIICLK